LVCFLLALPLSFSNEGNKKNRKKRQFILNATDEIKETVEIALLWSIEGPVKSKSFIMF
jgi:hypothetical protein